MNSARVALGTLILSAGLACAPATREAAAPDALSAPAREAADHALHEYRQAIIDTLGELVSFRTVHQPGLANAENPEFQRMTSFLQAKANELGLEFHDHGAVVVLALGQSDDRLGIVTHGDVQPADASKWARDPFAMDAETEPDRLIGRGAEDDKGPLAIALYGMKTLVDRNLLLNRRIELIVSYTEESDWSPMIAFVQNNPPPQLNIALDSKFPVVTAEKGFCLVSLAVPLETPPRQPSMPLLASFTGGSFVSQVPEDARAVILGADAELAETLRAAAESLQPAEFTFASEGGGLTITAKGKAAHSSEPEAGVNAIAHLATLLNSVGLGPSGPAQIAHFVATRVGLGHFGEDFGQIAYRHDFMGPMTVAPTVLTESDGKLVLTINLRRPVGKTSAQLEGDIRDAVEQWRRERGVDQAELTQSIGEPHYVDDAPHIPVLLNVFSHYTGIDDGQAVSAGGGTHARLLPNGLSFGPHMPHRPYSGHTEKEFLLLEELDRDIQMYTAMLAELAAGPQP